MNLKSIRKSKNISRRELSEKLEVSLNTIASWEQGIRTPPLKRIHEIAYALNVKVSELLKEEEENKK